MEAFLENLVNHWYWLPIGLVILIVLVKFLPRYKIAPPDTALIISGLLRRRYKVRNMDGSASVKRFGYRIVRGGATFWIPAIERIDKLDMCLMQVDIKTAQPVPTKEYISVLVDAVANIKIGSDELFIATAAEQLLHYDAQQIKALAKDVLEGNMREIIGQMTIAELVQNRDKFAQESIKAAMADMANMGLEIINLTIQNFADKDGNVIEEWVSANEPHYIEAKLIAGKTYTLREITAPDGYNTAEDIEFTVNADGSVTEVTMKDEAVIVTTPNVATGDTGKSPLGYIMVIAGLVLLTVSIFARKKKEEPADDYAELCPDFIEGEED